MTEAVEKKACPECGKFVTWTKAGKPRSHRCAPQPKPQAEGGVTVDRVIAAFISTRDEIAAKKKEYELAVQDLKVLQTKRGEWLKTQMDKLGMTGLKANGVGSCHIDWKDSAKVADPQVFQDWIFEDVEGRRHFLTKHVAKDAVKQYLEAEETEGQVPPGVDYVKVRDIKVRRA